MESNWIDYGDGGGHWITGNIRLKFKTFIPFYAKFLSMVGCWKISENHILKVRYFQFWWSDKVRYFENKKSLRTLYKTGILVATILYTERGNSIFVRLNWIWFYLQLSGWFEAKGHALLVSYKLWVQSESL